MKRLFIYISLLFVGFSLVITSCKKEGSSEGYVVTYSEVLGEQNAYNLRTDEGRMLYVVENRMPSFAVTNGQRVVANVTLLSPKDKGYEVRVNALSQLLTKKPVFPSLMTPEEVTALGTDPIAIESSWFSGKYLNINFNVYRQDVTVPHFINLVVDEQASTEERVVVRLTHNAEGDPQVYPSSSRVSFEITDLIPSGKKEITVQLKWKTYSGTEQSTTALYRYENVQ